MPSEAKPQMLQTPPEKPNHYRYLKEFRVEKCTLFPEHKCTQHRPFVCFNWHFPNQRRRRPIRKRDGTFNYSPDKYCDRYDETTGECPAGDECIYLHRTAGDTERRYHLRYFKTCMCVYETDSRGCCTKNGAHCAFAHGEQDKRPPVYDIRDMQNQDTLEEQTLNGPNQLDKERSMMVDDPKWQDANYVLVNYKTEKCQKLRLCQKGYACPQYHNPRDRRRSPKKHKYRSTPCPNVKHGDEWGEPKDCEDGDNCAYCHTRTEQQFHPEIYKSSKCHDVFSNQTCPRGPFCAFAHADHEMSINRNVPSDTNLADILSNALPAISSASSSLPKGDSLLNNNNILGGSSNHGNNNGSSVDLYVGIPLPQSSASSSLADFSSDTLRSSPDFHFGSSNVLGGATGPNSSSMLGGSSASSSSGATTIGSVYRPTFAKAVTTYSNAAAGGAGGSGMMQQGSTNLGGKFFDERKSLTSDETQHILNGVNLSSGGLLCNSAVGSLGQGSQSLFDLETMIHNNLDLGGPGGNYRLFASSTKGGRDEMSRNDSPSTDKDKDNEPDGFGGATSDLPLTAGSKPVSIPSAPGFQYPRERFPSGSSPMTNTHLSGYNSLGSNIFSKNDPIEAAELSISNNHSSAPFFEFSPRQSSTMSPRGSIGSINGFMGGNHSSLLAGNVGVGASAAAGGNGNTNSISALGNSNGGSGPGPIGSTNGSLHNNHFINVLGRADLAYMSEQKLKQLQYMFEKQAEAISKALKSYKNKDSPNFSCLNCKNNDRPRTVVLVPCDHQVLCESCAPHVLGCPLCGTMISNRKPVKISD